MNNSNLDLSKYIQNNISKLCPIELDEIFKILHDNNCKYTLNNNGIFVNLNWIDSDIIKKISDYISFSLNSQSEIKKYEIMKNIMNESMTKEKLDDISTSNIFQNNSNFTSIVTKQSKISSSMRFYLLKKKFLKKNISVQNNIINNNILLNHEEYIM